MMKPHLYLPTIHCKLQKQNQHFPLWWILAEANALGTDTETSYSRYSKVIWIHYLAMKLSPVGMKASQSHLSRGQGDNEHCLSGYSNPWEFEQVYRDKGQRMNTEKLSHSKNPLWSNILRNHQPLMWLKIAQRVWLPILGICTHTSYAGYRLTFILQKSTVQLLLLLIIQYIKPQITTQLSGSWAGTNKNLFGNKNTWCDSLF